MGNCLNNSVSVLSFFLLGIVLSLIFIATVKQRKNELLIYSHGLIIAAAIYVVFAIVYSANSEWLFIEVFGLLFFSWLARVKLKNTIFWLYLGWLIHPLWDILHLFYGHSNHVPDWYIIACISFDWVIAYRVWVLGRK